MSLAGVVFKKKKGKKFKKFKLDKKKVRC